MERTESVGEERTTPSPEVLEKPVRRRFTVEYKARILAEADACTEPGMLGELLRREGLYSSHLSHLAEATRRGRPGRPDAQAARSQGEAEESVGR